MIPETSYSPEVLQEVTVTRQPSLGWGVDFEKQKITGFVDTAEAVKQAIYLILTTERYSKPIYTWNYGMETNDLYQQNKYIIIPQLQKRVYEALYQDDRIINISNFKAEVKGGKYVVSLDVTTIYNETLSVSEEVTI